MSDSQLVRYPDFGGRSYRWMLTLVQRDAETMSSRQRDDLEAGLALLIASLRPDSEFKGIGHRDLLGRIAKMMVEDAFDAVLATSQPEPLEGGGSK